MQKKGNEIMIKRDGNSETYFYAAQRLKIAKSLESSDPCNILARELLDKLVEIVQFCPTLVTTPNSVVREKVMYISEYLSEHVLKPEPQIEAFLSLLTKMDAMGDQILIELEPIERMKRSYKDAASDLRSFTSCKKNERNDVDISNKIRANLKKLIKDETLTGYPLAVMNQVINEQVELLTSFLLLQREKTAVLDVFVDQLESNLDTTLLQHGNVRKSCADAIYLLHGKTAHELTNVVDPDPIVTKKLHLKLSNILEEKLDARRPIMNTVLNECTNYLATNFIDPLITKTCTCEKQEHVECTLDEKGNERIVTRPICVCSRLNRPTTSTVPGVAIAECPAMAGMTRDGPPLPCPALDKPAVYYS